MSPRRMDISSLLRDDTPPPNRTGRRSIDALLNGPDSPHSRPPFLGLDALVHVASEERRRLSASDSSERDRPLVRDHDPPSRHYGYPASAQSQSLHHLHDTPRTHIRARDTHPSPPPSPSPDPRLPHPSASPALLHSSASPINIYPTLRHQPVLHMDPRSAPAAHLPPPLDDPRTTPYPSLQHTPAFLHSPRPSPRNNSPLRHSPQQFFPQYHSPPVHPGFPLPPSTPADPTSPRCGYGPKMAGGIEILSNDSPTMPRHNLPIIQSPRRERLVSEPHARHETLKMSPLSSRVFFLDDDRHPAKLPPHQAEPRETESPREWIHPRPSTLADASMNSGQTTGMSAKRADFCAQPSLERHPIRVWEERPSRILPAHVPDVTKNVPTAPLSTFEELPPCAVPPEHSATPIERIRPTITTPIPSGSQAPLPHASRPPTAHVSASPVLDLRIKNFETRCDPQPERPDTQAEAGISTPHTPSYSIVTETILGEAKPGCGITEGDILMENPPALQPSPGHVQPVLAEDLGISMQPNTSQSTSRSPSQPPLLLPAKDEHGAPPENVPTFPPSHLESLCYSLEPEDRSKREPEQAMMDVDEELLSLVEDRPARVIPAMPKAQIELILPSPIPTCQDTGTVAEQSSSEAYGTSSSAPSVQPILNGTLSTNEEKDRASMPPPAARKKIEKEKTVGSKKKKDGTSKPPAKAKQPSKPRAKAVPKAKAKPGAADTSSKASFPKSVTNVNARSRSTSVIPSVVDDPVPEPDAVESDKEDDKLYCVCKTRYDEDRMMIACDRCDEWFHSVCVSIPDLEVDLVDQFICPPCVQKHSHLRTTWKRRCLFGLQHENPLSPEACHKPSRGAFSKYCSDECGVKYMRTRIAQWEKTGGTRDLLWESVKNAAKREGVVVCIHSNDTNSPSMMDVDKNSELKPLDSGAKRRTKREVDRLNVTLNEIVKERELMKRDLDMVMWREKVVDLAFERAGKVDECGWDQRLCFGEEEWTDFGLEVLESYEEERVKAESGDDPMPFDAASVMHGEWWCTGKKKCERHAGWQKLRAAEVSFDKETKEGILLKLTTREREIRKRIEDILYPQPTGTLQTPSKTTHQENQINGSGNFLSSGHVPERGKKRPS